MAFDDKPVAFYKRWLKCLIPNKKDGILPYGNVQTPYRKNI